MRKPVPSSSGTGKSLPRLHHVLGALRKLYGKPKPPTFTNPFELILYENVAYLADDRRREEAFEELKERVGLSPEKILRAPHSVLQKIARRGILSEKMAERLRDIASIALEEFGGDLREVVSRPPKEAVNALKKFPSIAEPGAEKILLFSGRLPVLALDSNGLRVLLRLGYGKEEKSYAKSYRSAQAAVDSQLKRDCAWLIAAYQLLRRHAQELCKRTHPRCEICPLRSRCAYGRGEGKRGSFLI